MIIFTIITIRENGITVQADERIIKNSNLIGPYIIHDLNGKLAIRGMSVKMRIFSI